MRKYYLDNIRWATVLVVVFYHVLFMYNHTLTSGVAGAVTDFAGQDALQYLLYPWFMVVLFLVSGACTRYALDKRSAKSFLAERTRKLLVPSTLGLLALWAALGALCWFFPPALMIAPGAGTLLSTFLLDPAFRPYMPERSEFDIYATMTPAREVGGDFYDFYFTAENKLGFLIADVSGKGIPAAMFMMTAKTIIKGYAESGRPVEEVFTMANEKLCENNEAGMFVTAWLGVLDLTTGMLEFANAGHNPPLVRHADGSFTYLKTKPGLMLAGLPGLSYKKNELQLSPGDEIYIYTDGVTEAADTTNELYGEQRLLELPNTLHGPREEVVSRAVKDDVMAFAGEAQQYADITMLNPKYHGGIDS